MIQMELLLGQLLGGYLQSDLTTKNGVRDVYARWLEESRRFLAEGQVSFPIDLDVVWGEWDKHKKTWLQEPNLKAQVLLVEATLRALPDILTGKKLATDVMFPNGSMELVEGIYKNNIVADFFNEVLADTVVAYLESVLEQDPSAKLRIFEIGAGSGGSSALLFQKLKPFREQVAEYCYTDISRAFLLFAEKEFGPSNPYLTYKIFNVESPVVDQGIPLGEYDLVIATNVLHATRNIKRTMQNTKALLRKNGLLLLNEISRKSLFSHLTFGLLEGWWLYEDPEIRIEGCPGLEPKSWQTVLEDEGFPTVFFPAEEKHDLGQQIVVAESDGVVRLLEGKQQEKSVGRKVESKTTGQMLDAVARGDVASDLMIEEQVREILLEKMSDALRMEREQIDLDQAFAEYGLDSILGVNLVQATNEALQIDLQTTDIFDHSSINQLAQFIVSEFPESISATLGQEARKKDEKPVVMLASQVVQEQDIQALTTESDENWQKEPIAIIGMSGRYAKSNNLEELWNHLASGEELVGKIERFDIASYHPDDASYCDAGSFLDDIDQFDPLFFNISGMEATYMDPQQRIFLEESWKALEDAGHAGSAISGAKCGVYVGCSAGDYNTLFADNPPPQALWGSLNSAIAARIAYFLNLQGPAMAVDTACSSSMVAIHLACQGLWSRETDMALAGGIYLQTTPQYHLLADQAGMLSRTGHCYTFDDRADGMVPGEAVGAVVLKRLQDALADGDHIYGVIRGTGINQDGTTNGLTAPSQSSQERLQRQVYDQFGIHPEQIQMVEAHGTGTKLGDPIEFGALTRAFRHYTDQKEYCAIGSIKTNIGHTQLAAGVTGVIKVLLSLQNRQMPPSLHFETGNSNIRFQGSPFFVNTTLREWTVEPGQKRMAAISAFGATGTNAHLVIEEAPQIERYHAEQPGYLIVLSARSAEQLQQQVRQLIDHCERKPHLDCGNISYTLLLGRKHLQHRLACVARTTEELTTLLNKWLVNGKVSQVYVSAVYENDRREQPSLKRYGNQCIENCQTTERASEYRELLATVADLYIQGYSLAYERLFADGQYARVSLPTYPFARERYWVSEKETAAVGMQNSFSEESNALHPLVHQNTSDLSEQRFRSTFTGREWFFSDAIGDKRAVFSAGASLEMVRAAIELAAGHWMEGPSMIRLQQISFAQPIVVGDQPMQLHVALDSETNGEIAFEIYDRLEEGIVYLDGCAQIVPFLEGPVRNFGPLSDSEGQAAVKLASPNTPVDESYMLHPGLLDLALQAGADLMSRLGHDEVSFPASIQELEIFGRCNSDLWALLRVRESWFDLDLCDEQGAVRVRMKGVSLQSNAGVQMQPAIAGKEEAFERLTFEEVWQEEALTRSVSVQPKTLVCLLSSQEHQQAAVSALQVLAPWTQVLFLAQGARFERQSPTTYAVPRDDGMAYRQAFEQIRNEHGSIDAVFYLWPLEDPGSLQDTTSLLHLLQGLAAAKAKPQHLLLVGSYDSGLERCYAESWIGFERSLRLVLPDVQLAVVCGEAERGQDGLVRTWVQRLWAEMQSSKMQSVLYAGDRRMVLQARQTTLIPSETLVRAGGTYLITGGLGGLGLLLAEHLADKHPVNLVLTGRSALDAEKQAKIRALESKGSQVLYVQADVCDAAAMREGVARARAHFGGIHGAIHAAGVLGMEHLLEKTPAQFANVLAPKVQGTLVLDEVLAYETLDFVCYYSSSSAILGDFGSCDYSIANRFLMAYAQYRNDQQRLGRRSGKNVVVNWPLWKDGGMGVDDVENSKMYLQASGQRYLEAEEGLEIWERLLGQQNTQHLVLVGQQSRVHRFLGLTASESEEALVSAPSPVSAVTSVSASAKATTAAHFSPSSPSTGTVKGRRPELRGLSIEQSLEWELKEMISSLLKVSRDKLEAQANLTDFGFDSLSLAEFAKGLTEHYGIEVTPALFYGHSTLDKLTRYFLAEQADSIRAFYQEAGQEARSETFKEAGQGATVASIPNPAPRASAVANAPKRRMAKRSRFAREPVAASREPEAIAIIGMSGRFPQASNLEELWTLLAEGRDAVQDHPSDRFPNGGERRWRGGWIDNVSQFDPLFFGISPREAETMDPRQRLLLQESWRALEDAGYGDAQIESGKIGMFVGVEHGDYQFLTGFNAPITSNHDGVLAARLAYFLNLHGPVLSINTACSSGLVAVHQACQSIRNQECDTAIAAGVNLILAEQTLIGIDGAGMLSPDGKCYTFDKRANGMVPGEAVAVVVLKRLSQAVADGDPIYAVIKGSGINYDGKTNGITAPSGVAQTDLLKTVYEQYRIDPERIDYIVTHGTGTKLGDPVEINALTDAFKQYTSKQSYCALTSTKTNFGHTFAASGIVSLISLVLAMRHETIPPSLHCEEENDYINWKNSPFYVNKTAKPWTKRNGQRLTGAVSAFGMSGTNAHLVVESYVPEQAPERAQKATHYLLALSAKSEASLQEQIGALSTWLQSAEGLAANLSDISYTLLTGRQHFQYRCALVVQDREDALHVLGLAMQKQSWPNLFQGKVAREFKGQKAIQNYVRDLLTQSRSVTDEPEKYQENLQALADFYCQGYEMSWERLYGERQFERLHLPTYPFAKGSYWVAVTQPFQATDQTTEKSTEQKQVPSFTEQHQVVAKLQPQKPSPEVATEAGSSNRMEKPIGIQLRSTPFDLGQPERATAAIQPSILLSNTSNLSAQAVTSVRPTAGNSDSAEKLSSLAVTSTKADLPAAPSFAKQVVDPAADSLHEELTASLAEALAMQPDEVDLDLSFIEMGLDSIIGVEWVQTINKKYNTAFTANVVYEHPNVRDFAAFLASEIQSPTAADVTPQTMTAIAESTVSQAYRESVPYAEPDLLVQSNATKAVLYEELLDSLAEALAMERSDVDTEAQFIDMGLDSIIGVEWIQLINKRYELSLTANVIYEYPTFQKFVQFLEQELKIDPPPTRNTNRHTASNNRPPTSVEELIQRVHQGTLSFDQADQYLQQLNQFKKQEE